MKHIVKSRTYVSPLRDEHAEGTRNRILDALIVVLAAGPAELSVPAVATAAGVSVPTVYRHFGSKRGLTDALYERYAKQIGADWEEPTITSVESFIARTPAIYRRHDEMDTGLRAAMSTDLANRLRRQQMPERLRWMEKALDGSGVRGADRDRMRDVFTILTSSVVQRAFKDYLDLGPDEAAERVAWTMRTLIDASKKGKGKKR